MNKIFCTLIFLLAHSLTNAQVNRYQTSKPLEFSSPNQQLNHNSTPSYSSPEPRQSPIEYKGQIQLFGGVSHDTYLGCLTCDSEDILSIWNPTGVFGKSTFTYDTEKNIWNVTCPFGSQLGNLSPWSIYAQNPPAMVDFDGGFYGYFTANQSKELRTTITLFNNIAENISTIDYNEMVKLMKK